MKAHEKQMSPADAATMSTMRRHSVSLGILACLGMALIAGVDYLTGSELRVFPLYFAPVSLVAWSGGRRGPLVVAGLCAIAWSGSNFLAGMRFSHVAIWIANTFVQFVSFATVGLLMAALRAAVIRERGFGRTDPLTSLPNRRAFYEEASRLTALCRRKGRPLTILYIDLDNLKTFNDRDGHLAGDDVLRSVADELRASLRSSDIIARLGGDEFVVLLPEVNPEEVAATVERLRSLTADRVASSPGTITMSIGGVTFTTVPDDVEYMVREADSRMYVAKSRGKNRVHLEVVSQGESLAALEKRSRRT